MDNQLFSPPGEGWQRVRLTIKLGPSLPAATEGWAIANKREPIDVGLGPLSYRFVTLTNYEVAFQVYADEIEVC